jgi:hypothetical protein
MCSADEGGASEEVKGGIGGLARLCSLTGLVMVIHDIPTFVPKEEI